MGGEDNADRNRSERRMERESSVRTVDCLRGRLLAERAASRNAKEEAQLLGNKLMELEKQLKEEAKSQKRAERKLKSLMKKLESMNISYTSDESRSEVKTDISSNSSTTSSIIKEINENQRNAMSQKKHSQNCLFNLSDDSSAAEGEILEQNIARNATLDGSLSSSSDDLFQKSSSKIDHQSDMCYDSVRSCDDEGLKEGNDGDCKSEVDESMALVVFDTPEKDRAVDPEVLDATVKEVLDALRYAKEQLQSSMERQRMNMIRVG